MSSYFHFREHVPTTCRKLINAVFRYNLCFSKQFGGKDLEGDMTAETIRKQMTDHEWDIIYKMTKDKNLYQNLINSIFPTIHGKKQTINYCIEFYLTISRRRRGDYKLIFTRTSANHTGWYLGNNIVFWGEGGNTKSVGNFCTRL